MVAPWYREPDGWTAQRFEMDTGDIALFAWNNDVAYWIGNTETPSALWQTEKYTFDSVPNAIADWATRELLAQLFEDAPWFADYPALSLFFLSVLLSKDGRETSQAFFKDHAAGFPATDPTAAAEFYNDFLATGYLDDHRYLMASKLGTSADLDINRMSATMGEFNVAKLIADAGYELTPEIEVTTGHSIDFRIDPGGFLVEVTRPSPPANRSANTPVSAVQDTAATKTGGQLSDHGGGITLVVDCSSFSADAWGRVYSAQPDVRHRPAVVFRLRPDGHVEGYKKGTVPIEGLPID